MLKYIFRSVQNGKQNRRSEMYAAVCIYKRSGETPSEDFYALMEDHIRWDRTLDEINVDIDRRYKEKSLSFANGDL